MHTYLIDLAASSGFITPWQADTIFGHLCWIAERHTGFKNFQGALGLIDLFRGGSPPFILSDGFPANLLPAPLTLKSLYEQQSEQKTLDVNRYSLIKRAKKRVYLTRTQFKLFQRGEMPDITDEPKGFLSATTLHNQISRLTNTTGEQGSLFERDEKYAPEGKIQIYAKISKGFENDLQLLFEKFSHGGYGAKQSTGKGAFKLVGFAPFDDFDLPDSSKSPTHDLSGFVTLSNFVPAQTDPTDGAYKIMVKYGKLGEEKTYCGQPFKKPLIMLKVGSFFRTTEVKAFYGRIVEDISYADQSVVQYGFAFPVEVGGK